MGSGLQYFPTIAPANTVIGRLASGTGPVGAIPFASLAAGIGGIGVQSILAATVAGTNTITAISASPSPALPLAANQLVVFIPAATNSGAATFNRDALGAKNVFQSGVALTGGELKVGVPVLLFYDGTQYHVVGITTAGTFTGNLVGNVTGNVTGNVSGSAATVTSAAQPAITSAGASLAWGTGVANFGTVARRKTADQSQTSNTVLTNDNDLSFSIAANEEWVAEFFIAAGNAIASTTGINYAITVPSGAVLNVGTILMFGQGSASSYIGLIGTTSGSLLSFGAGGTSGNSNYIKISVWVLNGANAGTVNLQWAQGTSSATALTFKKGSFLQATRVA